MNDPMATHVGQLPRGGPAPPIYQTKKDLPPTDGGDYDSILRQYQQPPGSYAPPATQPPGGVPGYGQQPAGGGAAGYDATPHYDPNPPVYDPNPPMAQYMPQAPPAQGPYEPQAQYYDPQYEQHRPPARPSKAGMLSRNKDVILITVAVFVLLFWIQPKARVMLPQFFGSNGAPNVLGMLSIGVIAGLLYRCGASYLPD